MHYEHEHVSMLELQSLSIKVIIREDGNDSEVALRNGISAQDRWLRTLSIPREPWRSEDQWIRKFTTIIFILNQPLAPNDIHSQ